MRYRTRWSTKSRGVWRGLVVPVLLVGLFVCASASAQESVGTPRRPPDTRAQKDYTPFPNPHAGYVTDIAGLLSAKEEEHIEQWLWQVESRTRVEIIVVTIDSIKDYRDTPNRTIEEFATGLFDAYGIGNLPENNGVLLLVARRDRKARIELGAGYGRRRDGDATRIMNNAIVPRFREGAYVEGITEGVKAIMLEFANVRVGTNWKLIILLIAIPVVGLIAYSLFKSGKRGWGWICVGIVIILVLALIRMIVGIVRHMPRGSSSSWSSGGLGGFGGGFSGGGGATGSW